MALDVLFKNKNTFLFLFLICILLNLQMCQIILADPVIALLIKHFDHVFNLMPLAHLGRNPAAGLYCKFNASIGMVE